MQEFPKFNNFSKETRESLPILEPGQVATYELLISDKDHITGRPMFGATQTFPGRDRILEKGKLIEIGIPRTIEGDVVKKCEKFKLANSEGQMVAARFDLNGDNPDHVLWHQYFYICSFREGSPFQNKLKKPRIRLVDPEAEARNRSKTRSALRSALAYAEDMPEADVLMLAASMNWDTTSQKTSVLRDMLGEYAKKNPSEFLKAYKDDPATKDRAEMKLGFDYGVITHDPVTHTIKWAESGQIAATLTRVEGKNYLESFVDFCNTAKNGADVKAAVKKRVATILKERKVGRKEVTEETN